MPDKITVLHLITGLDPGGAEVLLLDFVKSFDDDGYDVYIAYIYGNGSLLREKRSRSNNEKVIDLSKNGKFDPLSFYHLYKTIRKLDIDIIHTHLAHSGIIGRIVGKLAGVKVVTTVHFGYECKTKLIYKLEEFLLPLSDRIIAISQCVKDYLIQKGIDKNRIEIIRNAIALENQHITDPKFKPDSSPAKIGSIGRLIRRKGFATLIEGFSRIEGEAHLEIIGDGPERNHLAELITRLSLNRRVELLGQLPNNDVLEKLMSWDMFVFSPTWEGFGLVVLEAMSSGKPVIATDVGGIPEIIQDGTTGILVPPENPKALADKIDELINNPALRSRLGNAARKHVEENFTLKEMVEKTKKIYKKLVTATNMDVTS